MHSYFAPGIVKNHWYGVFIKSSILRASTDKSACELDVIHRFLETVSVLTISEVLCDLTCITQFETPLWAGKLPLKVGEPAGRSLSADEYKFAAMVALPLVVSALSPDDLFYANNVDLATDRLGNLFPPGRGRIRTPL